VIRTRRRALAAAALAAAMPLRAQPGSAREGARDAGPEAGPDCSHCKARLGTVAALRERLPRDWRLRQEREPVLGGDWLVVEAGPRQAPPLLLVHGLGHNGFTDWLPVMPALARDWRVIAVDLPGFGYASSPAAKLSPTAYARVLDALLARERIDAAAVAGHSMGAAVALRLAFDFPERVGRLVMVSTAGILHRTSFTKHATIGRLPSEGWPEALKEPVARLRDLGHLIVERILGLPLDPTEVLRANEWLWPLLLRDRSSVNAAMALVDEDFSEPVHTLRQPVHLIGGDADPVAPPRTGELLARRLPRAQLHLLRGIGHVPMAQATGDFLPLLQHALKQPPVPPAVPAPSSDPSADLRCSGEVDRQLRGRYRTVLIERCTALRLVDVVAERLIVRDSIVQMTGVQVRGADVALDIGNSELVATACDFDGRTAIRTDGSRLDLAGCRLSAPGFAVQALGRSRLVASVSEVRDALYRGWWHEDRELAGELLNPANPPRAAGVPRRP
jgi:pimeloyl-ACP methyl ester carboxylesterase